MNAEGSEAHCCHHVLSSEESTATVTYAPIANSISQLIEQTISLPEKEGKECGINFHVPCKSL
eukprot:9879851-Ditylum_brightwellii.AAC.1